MKRSVDHRLANILERLIGKRSVISHRFTKFMIGLLLLLLFGPGNLRVAAQQPDQWSPRKRIPGIHNLAETPYLVADQNRTVHAFHSQPSGDNEQELAIVYSQWTLEQGWSEPNDIILPPFGFWAIIQGAFLDQNGIMHLVFYGGNERNANIYYSRAPAGAAGDARAWSPPEVIGENAIENAALTGDDQGNLFALYSGSLERRGIYAVLSADGGNSWSEPLAVSLIYDTGLLPVSVESHLDQQGRLHASWVVNTVQGVGQEIYYARLEADYVSWSDPLLLAEASPSNSSTEQEIFSRFIGGSIVSSGDDVIVSYTACSPCEKWMRHSPDGGHTWTSPVRPFASRGSYGRLAFTIDGTGMLHWLFGDRHRGMNLWHSVWQGNRWQEPEPTLPTSAPVEYGLGPQLKFQPHDPRAVTSQGNVLLMSWTTDKGVGEDGTWYSYKILDLSELPVVPLPTLPATPTVIPIPTSTPFPPTPTPTPRPVFTDQSQDASWLPNNPASPLIVSIVPIVLIVVTVVFYQFYHAPSRR